MCSIHTFLAKQTQNDERLKFLGRTFVIRKAYAQSICAWWTARTTKRNLAHVCILQYRRDRDDGVFW